MTSINTAANYSGYYSLSGQSGSTTSSASTSTNSLLSALSGDTASQSSNAAYLLDLSPTAQQYLSGIGSTSSSTSSGTSGTGSFVLTAKQQQAITDILAKYKDSPFTQDTFNKIQDDLNAAGLGANTLSLQDQAKSFNPTMVLIDALNGSSNPVSDSGYQSSSDEQTKSSNYIQQVISQWKGISTTYSSTASGSTPAGSVTAAASTSGA